MRKGPHQSFQWSTDNNSKIVPGGGFGGHITPIDYHRFCWIYQQLGLEIEDAKWKLNAVTKWQKEHS